jgi:ribosomal protein S18 acetylase RimI-like enzyme
LFDETSRFIIVTSGDITAPLAVQGLGYAMYRFDTEEQMTSTDMIPVVYCYELQVSATVQGRGIGRLLVETLLQIGKVWHMQKIMLTVLKNNTPALAFYKKLK